MTRRKPPRPARRRPPAPAPPAPAAPPPAVGDTDPLADGRIRRLVERYCRLAGVKRTARDPDVYELSLPQAERPFFRERESLRVAFSLDALARAPDAEIAVLGSPFLNQLLEAIRARAARLALGLIAPTVPIDGAGVELAIPVLDGRVRGSTTRLARHPVGRLVARVVLRAGAGVEEAVVESDVYDLAAGARLDDDLAARFQELEGTGAGPAADAGAADAAAADAAPVAAREPADLLRLLLGNLREKSAERVAARRANAETALTAELERLDRYFASIVAASDPDAVATVTALAERRRTEEIRRSQVRAVVHPLQLVEAAVLMQRVEWQLESAAGRGAVFSAQRPLSGAAAWILTCPHCGRPPTALAVCRHEDGHCACEACSSRCSVCAERFCTDHGIAECRVDAQPACTEHVRRCPACRLQYCTGHEGTCAEGDDGGHASCVACLAPCGSCGRAVCNRHAQQSGAGAPKGSRRLCTACLRYCEGGTNEPVGVDEVTRCASCERSVCTAHQAVCAVDRLVHCSQHLRRTDGSRRLVCARHRAACAYEPAAVFASDEVKACATCGRSACSAHTVACAADGELHCFTHLEPLADADGSFGCPAHRKLCHVDGQTFSPGGAQECPICGKDACARHRAACGHCGRHVCVADLTDPAPADQASLRRRPRPTRQARRCATCMRLATTGDPPNAAVLAALAAAGAPHSSRRWRVARDRSHLVAEIDLGLTRKVVVSLRHGTTVPESVVNHSVLGSKRRRSG